MGDDMKMIKYLGFLLPLPRSGDRSYMMTTKQPEKSPRTYEAD